MRRHAAACIVGLALASPACIENHLSVDMLTQLRADGSCARRIEYRLERVDSERGGARVEIPPGEDALRQFHIPSDEPWRRRDETDLGLHVVTVEAQLPSPAAIEGDYWRARASRAQPSRNVVSAYVDSERGVYEYRELLQDPASPMAGARLLSRLALKADQAFAAELARAAADEVLLPPEAELRRLFRDQFASPFAREVAAIASRPFFGARERHELEAVFERLDERQRELTSRLFALGAGGDESALDSATDQALNQLAEKLVAEVEAAGLPLLAPDLDALRFHAVLVMPVAIVRANTCAVGDTAEWTFEEGDLFGRGFEMTAVAESR